MLYLNPFRWHYKLPFVFFCPMPGLAYRSLKIGLFPLFKLIFYCSIMSYFACFSLSYSLTFFCKALTCLYRSAILLICWLLKTISLTKIVGSVYFGKFNVGMLFGRWKLNLSDAFFPSSFLTTLFNMQIWKGTCCPLIGRSIALFLLSM